MSNLQLARQGRLALPNGPTVHRETKTSRMSHDESIYYPRRAGWRKHFRAPWYALRRGIRWERLEGCRLSPGEALKSFFLPGYSLWLFQRAKIGRIVVAVYLIALVLFIVRVGYTEGSFGFAVMIGLHACSLAYVIQRLYLEEPLPQRLKRVAAMAVALLLFFYVPLQMLILPRFFVPIRTAKKVVVIRTGNPTAHTIKRGDWVAYRIKDTGGSGYFVRGGVNLDMVRGLAGDRLVFLGKDMEINGKREPRPAFLPDSGEWVVPEGCWFIWPSLISALGYANAPAQIAAAQQQLAIVPMDQYVGTAFKYWFWRKQVPL